MAQTLEQPQEVQTHLSLWDAISIIVGIVIGAGIYETVPFILFNVAGPAQALGVSPLTMTLIVWGLGGLLSLIGALCYAELATTYPRIGGDYVYLTRAFGPWAGFLFGWAQLSVIMTGSIGMMAYIFADYACRLFGIPPESAWMAAAAPVVALTALNLLGVVLGKVAQNVLTGAKILGLGSIIAAGFMYGQDVATATAVAKPSTAGWSTFGLAMILVLYTYGGWNDAAFVAAEQRNQRRNIPLALLLGTALVTIVYLLINTAYILALGFDGAMGSKAIAADVLARASGPGYERAITILVMISALGAINGMIFTGSRIYSTLGKDHRLFGVLSRWHPGLGTPVWSLLVQAVITLLMIVGVGSTRGWEEINRGLQGLGLDPIKWELRGGFETLLKCTAPVFWLFFLMTGLSLFVLRQKDKGISRPFSVPVYPELPLIFCTTCTYMLYSAIDYAGKLTLFGFVPLIVGLLLYRLSRLVSGPAEDET